MNIRSGFASALKAIRKQRNLTQEDFSDISSRTYLSSLERGLKSPTLEKIDQLAAALNIHPVTLVLLSYASAQSCDVEKLVSQVDNEIKAFITS